MGLGLQLFMVGGWNVWLVEGWFQLLRILCVFPGLNPAMSTFLVRDLISKDPESCALEGGGP